MAEALREVRMMMKVMPSPGHGVVDKMQWTESEPAEWATSSVKRELQPYNSSYHIYTNDTSSKFPTLIFNGHMVPVGLSQEKCVYFSWAPASAADRALAYQDVEGLPKCSLFQLNAHDPHVGINVHAWQQKEVLIDCGGKSCEDACRQQRGWWVFSKSHQTGTCYAYDILDTVCVKVHRAVDRFGKVQLQYVGGCFGGNQTERYFPADPGCVYQFENVTVEVRSDMDPFVVATDIAGDGLGFGKSMVSCK